MTDYILLCVALAVAGFSVGLIAGVLITRRDYEVALAKSRAEWFTRGFDDGDYARRFYVARGYAECNPEYRAIFESECQPGGKWARAAALFGKAGV